MLVTVVAMAGQDRSEQENVMSPVVLSLSVTPRRSKLPLLRCLGIVPFAGNLGTEDEDEVRGFCFFAVRSTL